MLKLYVATTNPGKLRDFAFAARAWSALSIEPLPGLSALPEPVEDAPDFAGNARLKAFAYAAYAPGRIVLADDSGLEVAALGGAPGVRSARFAEDEDFPVLAGQTKDERNNLCLLDRTAHLSAEERQARYVCALAAVQDGVLLAESSGELRGLLLTMPRGSVGFGYDPLFLVPEHHLTMAELSLEARLPLSHRSRALKAILPPLNTSLLTQSKTEVQPSR